VSVSACPTRSASRSSKYPVRRVADALAQCARAEPRAGTAPSTSIGSRTTYATASADSLRERLADSTRDIGSGDALRLEVVGAVQARMVQPGNYGRPLPTTVIYVSTRRGTANPMAPKAQGRQPWPRLGSPERLVDRVAGAGLPNRIRERLPLSPVRERVGDAGAPERLCGTISEASESEGLAVGYGMDVDRLAYAVLENLSDGACVSRGGQRRPRTRSRTCCTASYKPWAKAGTSTSERVADYSVAASEWPTRCETGSATRCTNASGNRCESRCRSPR